MRSDVFLSIAQTPVDGHMPSEAEMFRSFFRQVEAADDLGFGVAWVAEAHLSTAVQRDNARPAIPHWDGEVGLNTNLPLLASHVFQRTRRIEVGSAVMNVVAMGGPVAAAEKVASMLALHGLDPQEERRLHIGFSGGRFAFANEASGVVPRSELERVAWPALRARAFVEAAEIFVRLLQGEALSSDDITATELRQEDVWVRATCTGCGAAWEVPFTARNTLRCRACGSDKVDWSDATWRAIRAAAGGQEVVRFPPRWAFERLAIIPRDWRRELLQLVVGSHDPSLQVALNRWAPVQVFNLSITPQHVIEATHARMAEVYHPSGGAWQRGHMPRTTFVFLDADHQRAHARARATLSAYWSAMDGTIDVGKVSAATANALVGTPDEVVQQATERFHPDDRLMLWFDFFDHDTDRVIEGMRSWMEDVVPHLPGAA